MIRMLLLALTAPTMAVPAQAQTSQEPAAFRDAMLAEVRKTIPEAEVKPDPKDPLAILFDRHDGNGEGFINVHRIYGYCLKASAEDCAQVKHDFLANITAKVPEASAEDLRLMVRDQDYVDSLKAMEAQDKDGRRLAYYEPLGGGLYAILAEDSPRAVALANDATLEKLKLTRDAAWALAKKQTQAMLPALPKGGDLAKSAMAYQDQEYLPSLLIDLAAWEKIAIAAGPDLFVTAVSDDFVFVGLMPDGPDLDAFAKTVREDCLSQERCISPHVYRLRDGHWVAVR